MAGKSPRYTLTPTEFPFQALATLASSTQMGSGRDVALATLVAARLAAGALKPYRIPARSRELRAVAARNWAHSLSLPNSTRLVFQRAYEASGTDDIDYISESLANVIDLVDPQLDQPSRLELGRLIHRISQERSVETLERTS